jgi:hypothetical protein
VLGRARIRPNRAARVTRAQRSTPGAIENDDDDEDDCSKHRGALKPVGRKRDLNARGANAV